MAFEKDPNEVGSIWVNTYPDGAVKFGGKAFAIPDGTYRMENFTTKFKDGREGHGIRMVRVSDEDIEAEKGEYHEEFVPAFAEVAGEKAPF